MRYDWLSLQSISVAVFDWYIRVYIQIAAILNSGRQVRVCDFVFINIYGPVYAGERMHLPF